MVFDEWRRFWRQHKKGFVFRVGIFGLIGTGIGFIGSLVATALSNGLFALLVLFFASYFLSFVWLLYGNVNQDERYYRQAILCGDIFIVASIWYGSVNMTADINTLWLGTLRAGSQEHLLLIARFIGELVCGGLLVRWYMINRLVYCIHMFKHHLDGSLDLMDEGEKSNTSSTASTIAAHV
ncbi:hypothetical protein M3Y94_00471600 [Aphelenchoides besseyi]|nr:hypothetical protein M3Y94_00471600 [Aphelenchoides besseyi]KAI6219969.1 hypothetical protein M3Y95_01083700 [Aphelenchoides besseyi]